jgi:hypothetical protein
MSDGPAPYRLAIIVRCRVAGIRLKPGDILSVPADKLKAAVGLCNNGTARPADRATDLAVQLHRLMA